MQRRRFLGGVLTLAVAAKARAEQAVSIVVPDLPGGEAGTTMRVLQPFLEQALDCPVVLDFRPGAGGIVGLMAGAQAAPDGSTLTLLSPAVTLAPWLSRRMDCTPADFAPLGQVSFTPAVLAVRANAPYAALADLLAMRAHRQALAAPAPSDWDAPQMAQALFLVRAGLSVQAVTGLMSEADRVAALLAGDVDLVFAPLGRALDPAVAARLRILAVSAPARVPQVPDVPSLRERGLDVAVGAWQTLALPAGAPREAVERLGATLKTVMDSTQLRAELTRAGLAPAWLAPDEAQHAVLTEYRAAGQLFAALGLSVQKEVLGLQTG